MKPNRNLSIASKYIDKQILKLKAEQDKLLSTVMKANIEINLIEEQIKGLKKQQEYLIGEVELKEV